MPRLYSLRRKAQVIIPLLLVIAVCFLTNATVNQHFHKLSSGIVIKHAHPYDKNNSGKPFQDHNHSSSVLILLDQISNPTIQIQSFIFILAPLLFLLEKKIIPLSVICKVRDLYFSRNYHAPPFVSY